MSDELKIAFTAAATLIGGVALFVIGKAVEVLVVIPLQDYKKQAQVALERVDFYAHYLTNYFSDSPGEKELALMRQISEELRASATQLKANYSSISYRGMLIRAGILPTQKELEDAFGNLIRLSNNLSSAERDRKRPAELSSVIVNNSSIDRIHSILEAK